MKDLARILLLLICCVCPLSANAKLNEILKDLSTRRIIQVQCKVFGFSERSHDYQLIVEGSLEINPNLWTNALNIENFMKTIREKINAHIQNKPNWTDLEKQEFKKETSVPVEIKSELFGFPGGTRLEISAGRQMNWEGNLGSPYIVQKVTVNGIQVLAAVTNDSYKLMFNESRAASDLAILFNEKGEQITLFQKPIITQEGQFHHIVSECRSTNLIVPENKAPAKLLPVRIEPVHTEAETEA